MLQKSLLTQHKPLFISGPCSAETPEQVYRTVQLLKATGNVHIVRAGIWKPRTRPGMFEGVGTPGLQWIKQAGRDFNLPVMVEVANAKHVEEALKAGIDIFWVGARTTVNPFSVQELADALKGVAIPVFIKNPINPDLELWAGAIERISSAGINQIGLIHRGFSAYRKAGYRNPPMWDLAIEMKRRFEHLPLICDPSHICGNREALQSVAQTSIDLGFAGLMLESHIQPDEAWSDARQQITPLQYANLIQGLKWRCNEVREEHGDWLLLLRGKIDQLDDELLVLLGERMKVADQIGRYKKENNVTILQTARWNAILERALKKMEALGLSRQFIMNYFNAVHLESIQHQTNIMNDE